MSWRLAFALLLFVSVAHAGHPAMERPLTTEDKARLTKTLGEILRDKHINQAQYDQSISWVNAYPCQGVDRSLNSLRKAKLEEAIAKEQNRKKVTVFESFAYRGWFTLFTDASDGDSPYMFYSSDPIKGGHPITLWSGAATIFETSEVEQWVLQNAQSIPAVLASCFAWHVTLSPE